jgi:hypothetical protein
MKNRSGSNKNVAGTGRKNVWTDGRVETKSLSGCLLRAYLRERGRKHNHLGNGRLDAGVCAQHIDGARQERGLISSGSSRMESVGRGQGARKSKRKK